MEISRGKGRGYVWREILIGNCLRDGVRDLIWTSGFASIGLWSRDGLSLRRALDVLQIFEARNFNSFILQTRGIFECFIFTYNYSKGVISDL